MKKKVFSLMMTLVLAFMGAVQVQAQTRETQVIDFEDSAIPSEWTNSTTYPWTVVTPAYSGFNGSFAMKSGNAGVSSSTSAIEATVEFTEAGTISFLGGCWGEGSSTAWDKCQFYIDGTEKFSYGALQTWNTYTYEVSAGTHTFKWSYSKDSSVNPTGDCFFVDDVTFTGVAGGGQGGFEDKLHVKYMDGETEVIDTLNLGVRPAGYWMEPFQFTMYSEGPNYIVNVLDFTPSDGMFEVSGEELPFNVRPNQDVELVMGTNENAPAGLIERQFVAITEGNRAAHIWPVTVELYEPLTPDVWELACEEATEFPFVEVPQTAHNMQLHNDYTLPFPEIPEGYDAVYKLVFANDMVLNAEVTQGENGKVALYTEDFYGEGGPMATNNYNGPLSGAGGAAATPFEAQIGEGTSTTGYFPFYTLYNYTISENLFLATELAEAGVTTAPMTSLSWYATNAPGYAQQGITIWMANVEDAALTTTSHIVTNMTKVYTGAMTPAIGWNEFVFNEGTFSWDGQSNVLIFCQRNNGAWNSTVNWQATTSLPFNAMAYRYQDSGAYDPTVANPMYTSTTRPNIILKAARGSRSGDVVLEEGFENGLGDWTMNNCHTSTGISTTYYHGGSSSFAFHWTTSTPQYLISPELTGTDNGVDLSFYYYQSSDYYTETFQVGYSTTTADPSAFTFGDEVTATTEWTEYTDSFPAGTKYVAVKHTAYDAYYLYVDDFTFTGEAGGEEPTGDIAYGPVITNAPVAAGTYYLVASSTDAGLEVTINAEEMPCPDLEGFAFNPIPADDEDELEPASVTLKWNNPANATEYQVVFGSTYYPQPGHPQTVISDWTPVNGATGSFTVRNLWNNTNYFWYVVFRNGGACEEGVESPHWGFTTHLNIPQNLTAVDETVFNDETITLNWTAVVDRTYRMYNVYRDGELIGHTTVNNISNTTYTDGPLEYNMEGYTYYVTAVYDEGESAPSNTVNVKVSGYGDVNGHVYEQDGTTGIAGATVTMVGQDEFGVNHTYNFQTNTQGYYTGHIYAGAAYDGQAAKDGYQTATAPVQGEPIVIVYDETTSPIDYILDENFDPVCTVIAEYYPDSLDPESPYVKVYWGCGLPGEEIIEPFETGDFSLFDWQIDPTYPWSITTNQPYEGTYCMKSGGAGVANVVSNMTVTVDIPADGEMSFFGKISSEQNWDYGYFFIDGQQMGSYTGAGSWGERRFGITAGTHTFQWRYTKDGSVNSNDDCFYVDYITFYKRPEPLGAGWHTFLEGEFNDALRSNLTDQPSFAYHYPANLTTQYNGFTLTKVSMFSDNLYGAVGGNYTCYIYEGGSTPGAGTLVSTQAVTLPVGLGEWVDWDLTTPVPVHGGTDLWVVWHVDQAGGMGYPAGMCNADSNPNGDWWDGGEGWGNYGGGVWTMRNYFNNRAGRGFYDYASENAPVAIAANSPIKSNLRTYVKGDNTVTTESINPNAPSTPLRMENSTRSLNHYRVYRTNCYQECPFTEENTVLLATVWVPDTVYIDVEWADLEPGVYKWGVGAVYEGNRGEMIEAPINWAAPVTITRDATADNDPNPVTGEEGVRAPWDLMTSFSCTSGYQYGVATDGNYIYTCSWSSSSTSQFYKYDMNGNFVEEFNVSGSGQIRDLTYDGQYFYGVANSTTVYCLDLANHALVNTFTSGFGAAQRGITYDPQRDGFWVIGNWSGNLTLINRQGAVQFTGPAPTSASGLAYYKDDDNVEHVFCFNNGDNGVYDYNITTNTMGGSVFNFSATPGYASGSAGGCHVAEYNGKMAFFGDLQQSPNLIGIYELRDADSPTPGPGSDNCNQLALPRESETIWSNCLDKDMFIVGDSINNGVTVNVLLNSADSPEGVQVTFTNYNEAEQEMYPVDPIELDETGFYAFESFRKGEYNVKVEFDGYEPIEDSVSIWAPTDLRYVMTEIIYGVSDLYVSSTGWAMWGAEGLPPTPGPGPGPGPQPGDDVTIILTAGDVWGDGSGYQMLLDADATAYGTTIPETGALSLNCSGNEAIYAEFEYKIPANADGNCSTQNMVMNNSVSITVPAGTYDWCITNPTPGDRIWIASAQGNVGGRQNDYVFEAGNTYEFTVTLQGSNDAVNVNITGGAKNMAAPLACGEVKDIANVVPVENGRHLEYFKVMCTSIDGEPIFNADTEHPFCQVNTESLVAGEHYIAKVAAVYSTGMSAWSECEWQYIPCDNYAGTVNGVEVNGNEISWEYPGGGPGPQPGQGDAFSVDFEAGLPAGWNVIDANNDTWTWCLTSAIPTTWTYYASLSLDWYRSGTNAICSGSYINGVGALNPDEYLVTPQVNIANGSTFSFWAAATDASYAADHFGVFVSDNGTSDWTMVNEWTLTAKNGVKAGDLRASRDGNGTRLGNWYNYSVDLSAFAGQKYIAIRHFNCYDQYIMCVDDIELTNGAKSRDTEVFFNGFVTDPGAMANGADASWIKNGQATWGPNVNNGGGYMLADQFTLSAATTISEIEVYGYQTGSSTTSTFTGLYAQIYNGSPMSGGTAVWGSMTDNIMTATAFTNCYRGSDGETNATTRPIMSITAGNLNIDLEAGTYYLVYSLTGSGSSGPWGAPHCEPAIGNTGNGLQYTSSGWGTLLDSGSNTPYGCAMKLMGNGGTPGPGPQPGGDVLGAMIFVDGEWEAFVEAPTNTYTYEGDGNEVCVRMVYNGTNNLPEGNIYYSMSCPECVEPTPGCAPGEPIHAEVNNATDEVTVWWGEQPTPPAQPIEEWLYYDDGANVDAIGLTNGGSFYWGIKFPAASLSQYVDCSVTKIAYFDYTAHTGTVRIYNGSNGNGPGTLIGTYNYTANGTEDWAEWTIPAVAFDNTQDLWIVMNNASGQYVASLGNYTGDPNGTMISTDGSTWYTLSDATGGQLTGTWNLRCFVSNQAKGEVAVLDEKGNGTPDGVFANAGVAKVGGTAPMNPVRATMVQYNVYRSTDNETYEMIGSVPYVEGQTYYEYVDAPGAGNYYYQVRALYDNDCESEPAPAFDDPTHNYVTANVDAVNENSDNVALYPNPTKGNVTIEAAGMSRITVVSVLGQVVYDTEVSEDTYVMNMSQFTAGMYMVRVYTESGVTVKRVTVMQ